MMRVGLRDQEDGELIAAEAGERVLGIEVTAQPAAEREQHAVADDEAEALVHVLEAVDVDEEHGGTVGLALAGAGDGALQAIHEQLAVGKAGQAVMHRVVDQPLMGALEIGHVAHQAGAAKEPRVLARRGVGAEVVPKIGAVVAPQAEIDLQVAALLLL